MKRNCLIAVILLAGLVGRKPEAGWRQPAPVKSAVMETDLPRHAAAPAGKARNTLSAKPVLEAGATSLSGEDKHSITAQILEARRWFAQSLSDQGIALVAHPDGQAFHFLADARGVAVVPDGKAGWSWKLRPADGRPAVPRTDKEKLSYGRGEGVTEWFVNSDTGIEHGFTLAAESGRTVRKVSAVIETELTPVPRAGRDGLDFVDAGGAARLHYDGLTAFDAAGRTLESWMEVTEAHGPDRTYTLTLAVNTEGARFPVTIDPVISLAGAAIQPVPVEADDAFASDMEIAGDLLVVGAPARKVLTYPDSGAVFVFRRETGTAFGWTQAGAIPPPLDLLPVIRAFGKKTALGGGTLAVACERDDPASGFMDEVRLYALDAAGAASPLTTLRIGRHIEGSEPSVDVSSDGNTVAVGSASLRYEDDPGQPRTGRVLIFEKDAGGPGNWGIVATLQPPSPTPGAGFGRALSLSGNRLAVGAPGLSGGKVFVFERLGGTWAGDEVFTPPAVTAPATVEGFGSSVSLRGNWLAIGAPESDSGLEESGGADTGRVILAERQPDGGWTSGSLLPAAPTSGGELFGMIVDLGDGQLSIAGPGTASLWRWKNSTSPDAALHWVPEREDSLTSLGLDGPITSLLQTGDAVLTGSAEMGKITARRLVATGWPVTAAFREGGVDHLAGAALARDGDLLAVGAPGETAARGRSVYVLRRSTGAAPGQDWSLAHTFTDNSGGFGSSLALKDGVLLIGAPGAGTGLVLAYHRQNAAATSWSTPQLLFPPVTFPAAAFGTAIAYNGVFAVVGDPAANRGGGGAVVFQRPASGGWPVVMGGTAAHPYRGYGAAVALTEANDYLVGAPGTPVPADVEIADGGAVLVWRYQPVTQLPDASVWTPAWTLDQPLFPDGSVSDRSDGRFGASVAMHGQHALIGAPGDGTASQRGRVFVFHRDGTPQPPAAPAPTQMPWRKTATLFAGNLTDTPPAAPFFGHAVALNAAHAVIGAPGDVTHAGQVFVYRPAPGGLVWAPVARMADPSNAPADGFGSAVAAPLMDEIAAGAPGKGVSIFSRTRSDWRLVRNVPARTQVFSNLVPTGFGEGPLAVGSALAMDGNWLVVGAPRMRFITEAPPVGASPVMDPWKQVFVLHRHSQAGPGSDTWEATTVLTFGGDQWAPSPSMNNNRTGLSLDISGRNIIVGETSNLPDHHGAAYLARLEADGTQPEIELTPDGYLLNHGFEVLERPAGVHHFGHAVSISGSYAVVAGPDGLHDGMQEYGLAAVYEWRGWHDPQPVGGGLDGVRQWKRVKTLGENARGFGSAVALDGLRLAVGAARHRNAEGGSDGKVLIFERDLGGPANWGLRKELELPQPVAQEGQSFGMGGALALEGGTLVAGANGGVGEGYIGLPDGRYRSFGTGGTAVVFEQHAGGPDNWGPTATLYGTDSIGVSVAISGDLIALGSPGGVFSAYDSQFNLTGPYYHPGSVTLYHRHEKKVTGFAVEAAVPAWGNTAHFGQENPAATHTFNFGAAVALSGGTLAIGAPGTTGRTPGYGYSDVDGTLTPGRAFVYDLHLSGTRQWHDLWLPDIISPAVGGTPYSSAVNPGALDFDNDGLTNILEQFHGLDPYTPDARNGGMLTTILDSATGALIVTWREAPDHGLTVTPQWSRDLNGWFASGSGPLPADVKTITVTTLSTHPAHLIKQARIPSTGETRLHFRLRIE